MRGEQPGRAERECLSWLGLGDVPHRGGKVCILILALPHLGRTSPSGPQFSHL